MRTMVSAWMIAAFLAVLAIASGCEDSPVNIGKGFEMILLANPSTVRVDPSQPDSNPTVALIATIVSDTGVPKEGVVVFFTSNGGALASANQGVTTDGNGTARDTMTVGAEDPAEISVTATATTLTKTVKVTKTIVDACAANTAPTAEFLVSNPPPGLVGTTSVVSPTDSSSDASPGVITSYAWDCGNGSSGGVTSTPTCSYVVGTVSGIFNIKLTVKDDGSGGAGPTYPCQKSSTISHSVTVSVAAAP